MKSKKTIILLIALAILVCAAVIAGALKNADERASEETEETTTYSEPIKVPEVTTHKSILSPEEYVPIKLEDAMKIKKGMSRYEVHDLIGLPEVAHTFSGIAYPFAPKWGIEDGSSLFIYFYFDGVVENAPAKYISKDYIEMIVRFDAEREKSGCDWKGFYDGLSEEDKAVWDGCVPKAYSAIIRDKDGTTVLAELFTVKGNDGADDSLLEQIKDRMTYDEVTEIIGKPQRYLFDGSVMLMQWDMKSGDIVQMSFGRSFYEKKGNWKLYNVTVIPVENQQDGDNWV